MTRVHKGAAGIALALLAAAGPATADEVQFNNGDRLTGKIVKVEGGKITIKSKLVGEVTADLKDVKTFATDEPVDLRTKDGQRTSAKAVAADAGQIRVETAPAREVPLEQIKYVNFSEDWTGSILAGAMFTRGNTFEDSANLAFELARQSEIDRWTFTGGFNFGRQRDPATGDKTTTSENWFATGKYDYFLNERLYLFGAARYEHDRIADLDIRLIPSVGVGYLWADRPGFKFDTEVGLAYLYEKFEDGDNEDSIAARLAYHYKNDIYQDKVSVFHNLEYYPSLHDGGDFFVVTDIGVRASITDRMFTEYKFEYRHDASPADGASKNDLRHVIGVGWRF